MSKKTLLLHPGTGDLQFDGHRDLRMVDGIEELAQALRLRLQTNRGEWFLDSEFGLDYSLIWGQKAPDPLRIRAEIVRCITSEPRIAEIEELSLDFDDSARKLTVKFWVRAENGDMLEEEVSLSA